MNLKTKIFVLMAFCLFSVSLATFPAATAFASDSFSQKVNDEAILEAKVYTVSVHIPISFKVGDQFKWVIMATNKTMLVSTLFDSLWVAIYNNSAANRTWQLIMPTSLMTIYNSTKYWNFAYLPIFIPHNQTAVNWTLYIMFGTGNNYTWTSGPNGYDGTMTAWEGPATGALGKAKIEARFNANGVLQYWKEYNGTGSGWTLTVDLELLGGGIPGFLAFPLLLILSIFVAFQIFRTKKKPVAI